MTDFDPYETWDDGVEPGGGVFWFGVMVPLAALVVIAAGFFLTV